MNKNSDDEGNDLKGIWEVLFHSVEELNKDEIAISIILFLFYCMLLVYLSINFNGNLAK